MRTDVGRRQSVGVSMRICQGQPDWSVWAWSDPTKVVYGPVPSRRLGASLGVNFFPHGKICSFKCAYCDLDVYNDSSNRFSLVSTHELERELSKNLKDYRASGRSFPDSITFAGNGEPTLHPGFAELVRCVRLFRDENMPNVPLNLFTNGLHLNKPGMPEALSAFRRIFLKLDGSSQVMLETLNGSGAWRGTNRAVGLARELHNTAASTMVVTGGIDNTKDIASSTYACMVNLMNPLEVYLYTLDYPTKHSGIEPVSQKTLLELAETLSGRVFSPIIVLWREYRHPTITAPGKELDVAFA